MGQVRQDEVVPAEQVAQVYEQAKNVRAFTNKITRAESMAAVVLVAVIAGTTSTRVCPIICR